MHIHGNPIGLQSMDLYSAAQVEKNAATRRASQIRKKLLNSAASLEGEGTLDEAQLIGRWLASGEGRSLADDRYSPRDPEDA